MFVTRLVLGRRDVTVGDMKRASRCSVDYWAIDRLSFRSPRFHRQRVRKRRFPLPRQTRGRDLDVDISYRVIEPGPAEAASPSTAPEIEGSKFPVLVRGALWICVIISGLILFGDWVSRFVREAPFAWPSIND